MLHSILAFAGGSRRAATTSGDFSGPFSGEFMGNRGQIELRRRRLGGQLVQRTKPQQVARLTLGRRIDGEWSCSRVAERGAPG